MASDKITEIVKKYADKKIGVLYGGWSEEREISLLTGKAVSDALKKVGLNVRDYDLKEFTVEKLDKKEIDIAYIALHGKGGEDGTVQAALDHAGIKYTGSNARASSIAINKYESKMVMNTHKIPTPECVMIKAEEAADDCNMQNLSDELIAKGITFPCVAKPVRQGSAIGVYIVKNLDELIESVKKISKLDSEILIEKYIKGIEITVGIVGDMVLPIIEIVPKNAFYDFEAKYSDGMSTHIIPARISKSSSAKAAKYSEMVHNVLGLRGVSRVDLIVDSNGEAWVLEVNTIPGMTRTSLLPDAAKYAGISFEELVLKILDESVRG
ncbi:MAG: D-alanine--D-alanine ligase [Elusimicrobiota bacterium]